MINLEIIQLAVGLATGIFYPSYNYHPIFPKLPFNINYYKDHEISDAGNGII
jgi:hypothetical protein